MNRLCLFSFSHKKIYLFFVAIILSLSSMYAGIIFNGTPGTAAPPPTLGGYTMTAALPDARPYFTNVSNIPVANSCTSEIGFSIPLSHRKVPQSWLTWSHGYTGDVYYSNGATTVTLTLPSCTRAIYFYAEPNPFAVFTVVANANDGTTSGPLLISGSSGAAYIGFYTTSANCMLTTITVSSTVDFAVGEFGTNILGDINNGALACNDNVQISLDQNCEATITPEMVLEGEKEPICPCDYVVTVRDWYTNVIIDIDPTLAGPQIGRAQIGKELKITVTDPFTGNSCWGKAYIEDKLPPILVCPPDQRFSCLLPTDPAFTGTPLVFEACSDYVLSYKDVVVKGSCALGFERIITRTWTAIDATGNKSFCIQTLTILLADLNDVVYPPHYDGLPLLGHEPMLLCDEKFDANKNVSSHILPAPDCVDDYLLDEDYFKSYGIRRPKTLGWNCIPSGPYAGNPNPDGIYYAGNLNCWQNNEVIMWFGTGRPSATGCSNVAITFRDLKIDIARPGCDAGLVGCYKILREWTILDWCTGEIRDSNQIIKVMDLEGPQVLYPDSLVVETDVWKCEGRWDVSRAWVVDNCSNDISYTVVVEDGTVLGSQTSGYVVVNLPLGIQNAYIVAEDCCGNITEKLVVLDVQDNTPPTAVCDQKTTVTINGIQSPGENTAKIFAQTFDDGSFDNCSAHLFYKVIRMDELLGTNNGSLKDNKNFCKGTNGDDDAKEKGNQIFFDDFVKFCCDDVGSTVLVVFRVFDKDPGAGPIHPSDMNQGGDLFRHFSDCMVEVEVQDKSIPTVVAPPDIVVSCTFWVEESRLLDPNDGTFGKIVNDLAWRTKVITNDVVCSEYCDANVLSGYPGYIIGLPAHLQPAPNKACQYYRDLFDPAHPDTKYELLWGFDGYVLSSCGITPTITIRDLRECGQGAILRDINVRGPNGIIVKATQTIWVVNCDPFYIDRENDCSDEDDIIWPDCAGIGTFVDGCGADVTPDKLGRPRVLRHLNDHCSLIAIEPFDEIFTIEPDACYKILRRWVVIDWCQYDPNIHPTNGRWEHTQVIKVRDNVSPIVTCNVGPCEPAVLNPQLGYCFGHISLTATASDSCTPNDWLYFEYKIDAFNNGTYDFTVGRLTRKEYNAGILPIIATNPYADSPFNPFNASGIYPIGIHKIKWFVEDGCGNLGTCETLFEVKDCKAPTPYCLTGIITVPMPSSGCVDIWAKDLDANSNDNCTPKDRLKFYFNGDTSKPSIRVCCSDFVAQKKNDQLIVDVQVWVEDLEGNKDYCSTSIIVQDNQDICPNVGTLTGTVSGLLKTENGEATSEALVDLYNGGIIHKNMTTSSTGSYIFFDLTMNDNYVLKATRDGDYLNGVTTADIVKLQRHILGMEELNSPYKLLAADVNRSGNITAKDMSDIRKLILGVTSKFDNSPSWLLIPQAFTFDNVKAPWNYTTQLNFTAEKNKNNMDFIAVKIGDVNNTVKANAKQGISNRSHASLQLVVEELELQAGTTIDVPVYANNFSNISGYQFTIKMDTKSLKFEGFQSGVLSVNESNFGLMHVDKGLVTTSWNADRAISAAKNEVLFMLTFSVQQTTKLSEALIINSDVTPAAAYDAQLNEMDVELGMRNGSVVIPAGIFELYQNNPNPFDKQTTIQFSLPESMPAVLTIYDVTGKVAYKATIKGQQGVNAIVVERSLLAKSGMFYYQLDADKNTATKKMVIIE